MHKVIMKKVRDLLILKKGKGMEEGHVSVFLQMYPPITMNLLNTTLNLQFKN